ncbi:hypothetical protein D3C75_1016720 [compost metagenome]
MEKLRADQVPGHQPAVEQSGEKKEEHELVAVAQIPPGQRVGKHGNRQQAEQCAENGNQDGHPVCLHDSLAYLEDEPVGRKAELPDNKLVAILPQSPFVG